MGAGASSAAEAAKNATVEVRGDSLFSKSCPSRVLSVLNGDPVVGYVELYKDYCKLSSWVCSSVRVGYC